VLTFRPQYAHYLVSKLVELQVDIEEKDDIIEKKDDIIERLKEENEQLKRENKQIIATVQEMTNCREESHAVSVTSEDNEAGDGEEYILCASLKDSLLFKEIPNCVDEDEEVDHAVSVTEDNEEGNVQENVVCMSFADYLRYIELKMSNSPSMKDFTFVDDKTGDPQIVHLELNEVDVLAFALKDFTFVDLELAQLDISRALKMLDGINVDGPSEDL